MIIPVKKAIAGETGFAFFSMDGTQGAGIQNFFAVHRRKPNAQG